MEINKTKPIYTNEWMKKYLGKKNEVHSFYSYLPFRQEDFLLRVKEIDTDQAVSAPREKLVHVIRAYHEPDLLHPSIEHNLSRLSQSDSLVVIGGHQACLLTGPLFTIYKAITIIQTAQREEKKLGRPVIPIFWIAGEDHDWEEVNHICIQDANKNPLKVLFPQESNNQMISNILCIPSQMHTWLEKLSELLPDSSNKKEWLRVLKQFTSEPISWSRLFAKLITYLFGKYGLLLIDSHDYNLRKLELPFWEVLIRKNKEIQDELQLSLSRTSQMNYLSPIQNNKNNFSHIFFCHEGVRYPLFFDGVTWEVPGINKKWRSDELLQFVRKNPDKLSNNVMTRPMIQEYLFSSLAFVGGAGEVRYWGLLKDLFRVCGLRMPIVIPRYQITLLSRDMEKRMKQFGVSLHDIVYSYKEKREEWIKKQPSFDFEAIFSEATKKVIDVHDRLLSQLQEELNFNFMELGQENKNKLMSHLHFLKRHALSCLENKYEVGYVHWEELSNTLSPKGRLQERTYNLISYWNLYGIGWVDQLVATLYQEGYDHGYLVKL